MTPLLVRLDTNVIVRLIARDQGQHVRIAAEAIRRAEKGELILHVDTMVVAECTYVLAKVYDYGRSQVARALIHLATMQPETLCFEEADTVIAALKLYETTNVDFVEAYVAAKAARQGECLLTFDRDAQKLPAELLPLDAADAPSD